jgi:hypothetical protein
MLSVDGKYPRSVDVSVDDTVPEGGIFLLQSDDPCELTGEDAEDEAFGIDMIDATCVAGAMTGVVVDPAELSKESSARGTSDSNLFELVTTGSSTSVSEVGALGRRIGGPSNTSAMWRRADTRPLPLPLRAAK